MERQWDDRWKPVARVEAQDNRQALAMFAQDRFGSAWYDNQEIESDCGCWRYVTYRDGLAAHPFKLVLDLRHDPCETHEHDMAFSGVFGARKAGWW